MTPKELELKITRNYQGMKIVCYGRDNNFTITEQYRGIEGICRHRRRGIGMKSNPETLLMDFFIFTKRETCETKFGIMETKNAIDEFQEKYESK